MIAAGRLQRQFQRVRDIASLHRGAELPGDDVAAVVVEDGRQVEPPPADDLEIGEVGLPELVGSRRLVPELIRSPHHHVGWSRDQVFGFENAVRIAFKQPIGSFQSIQHMAADMTIAVDGTALLAREALWRLDSDLPADLEVSQAKAFANQHCVSTCRSAQQIHGGMGFMMEFDLHLWYRRVVSWSLYAGTTFEHRRVVSHLLLDSPGQVRLDDCHIATDGSKATLAA